MKRVFTFTLLLSFAVNSALPEWVINSENNAYSFTGSSCIQLTIKNKAKVNIISKSIAQADLIEKQGVTVSSKKRMTTDNSNNQTRESFNQTVTTQSQGYISSVNEIASGFYTDELGSKYHCTWVGIK